MFRAALGFLTVAGLSLAACDFKSAGDYAQDTKIVAGPQGADDLPDGYSLYPDAKMISSSAINSGGQSNVLIGMQSADTPEKIAAFYRGQAEAAGIVIEENQVLGTTIMMIGEGEAGKVFTLNVTPGAGGGAVAYLLIGPMTVEPAIELAPAAPQG